MNWKTTINECDIFIKTYNQGESDVYTDTHGVEDKKLMCEDATEKLYMVLKSTPTPPRIGEVYDRVSYICVNGEWNYCGFVTTMDKGGFQKPIENN